MIVGTTAEARRTVVFVVTHFPPEIHVGAYRNEAFARYLDASKYDLHFVVEARPGLPQAEFPGVQIHALPNRSMLRPLRYDDGHSRWQHRLVVAVNVVLRLFFLQHHSGWMRLARRTLRRLHASRRIEVLVTQYGPIAPHLVGLKFKGRHPEVRWIADNRDVISDGPFSFQVVRLRLIRLETKIVNAADAVTSVSVPFLQRLARNCTKKAPRFVEVRNGHMFQGESTGSRRSNPVFTMRYVGSLYGQRKPYSVFRAMERLLAEQVPGSCVLEIAGNNSHIPVPAGLADAVRFLGTVGHSEAIELMRSADALVLIHPTQETKGIYPAKVFEYLAARRPILCLTDPTDVAAALVRQARAGLVCANEDLEGVYAGLRTLYERWARNEPFEPDEEVIRNSHRRLQVERMEQLIEELCG